MSKKSKNAAKEKRLSMKRGKKDAMQRQYASWAEEGKNSLSKRAKLGAQRKSNFKTSKHLSSFCGNLACVKCHFEINDPWQALPGSSIFSKRWTSRLWRNAE